jgi:hypothetical protein
LSKGKSSQFELVNQCFWEQTGQSGVPETCLFAEMCNPITTSIINQRNRFKLVWGGGVNIMSKNVMLSDKAYQALLKHKKKEESFSDVVNRRAPPPIETFGDLEEHLDNLQGALFSDMAALRRVSARKKRLNSD